MESEDYKFLTGFNFLLENRVSDLDNDLTFSTKIQDIGVTEVISTFWEKSGIEGREQ